MKNLIEHSKTEMRLLEESAKEKPDKELKEIYNNVIKMIEIFNNTKHSEASAIWSMDVLFKLLNFENLTELTSAPEEWVSISDKMKTPMWQSIRNPRMLSKDGGKTWFHISTLNKK